jgi:hypothetical protein
MRHESFSDGIKRVERERDAPALRLKRLELEAREVLRKLEVARKEYETRERLLSFKDIPSDIAPAVHRKVLATSKIALTIARDVAAQKQDAYARELVEQKADAFVSRFEAEVRKELDR